MAARASGHAQVLGMRHGVQGALGGAIVDLAHVDEQALERLKHTPSAALGSCRYKFAAGDAARMVALCQERNIETLVYIGGNDSADTSLQILRAARATNVDLSVVGVPKTIDNDLAGTDHCPGYGS